LQKEREIVLSLSTERVYNLIKYIDYSAQRANQPSAYRRNSIEVIVNGVYYPSIRQAAHMNNVSLSSAHHCLNNPNNMNWVYADPTNRPYSNISKMIVVDDTLYISLSIAAAILNISTKKIRKYIRERENMNYFSDLSEDEKQRIL